MEYVFIVLFSILAVLLSYIVFLFIRFVFNSFHKNFVPFVPSPAAVMPHIISALNLNEKSILYDLGAGDGRIVCACHNAYPNATCIGIEKELWPYVLGRTRYRKNISEKFKFIRGNLFDYSYTDATHITTYLLPEVMDELLPKLERELAPGTKLISIDFPFTKKMYKDIISTSRSLHLTGRKIYIYEF